ncbi:MAG TPA: Hsp20/alpha crystallin family protein [Burkholderiaceae bacterium]
MYESLLNFPGAFFNEFERLRRELDDVFGATAVPTSIRSVAPGTFPAINVGNTPDGVDVYAFAPGLDASKIEVQLDRGVLSIRGERPSALPGQDRKATVYSRERLSGSFHRAISLPDDADAGKVEASYRDGVLHVHIARHAAPQPQRITVQ